MLCYLQANLLTSGCSIYYWNYQILLKCIWESVNFKSTASQECRHWCPYNVGSSQSTPPSLIHLRFNLSMADHDRIYFHYYHYSSTLIYTTCFCYHISYCIAFDHFGPYQLHVVRMWPLLQRTHNHVSFHFVNKPVHPELSEEPANSRVMIRAWTGLSAMNTEMLVPARPAGLDMSAISRVPRY